MLDAKKLLGQFLGSSGKSRGGPSSVDDILSQFGGQSGRPGQGGGWQDKAGQLTQMARNNPAIATAAMTALLGSKRGRKLNRAVCSVDYERTGIESKLYLSLLALHAHLLYQAYRAIRTKRVNKEG